MNQEIPERNNNRLILSGNWKNTTFWNFYLAQKLPNNTASTAVTGLIILENKVVLVKNHRGWELPGGHIEIGETIESALVRELHEEAGLKTHTSINMFGYNEIINPDTGKTNKATGKNYPKYAYNPHYIIEAKEKPIGCLDGTCDDIGFFDITCKEIAESKVRDIILIGYAYHVINSKIS